MHLFRVDYGLESRVHEKSSDCFCYGFEKMGERRAKSLSHSRRFLHLHSEPIVRLFLVPFLCLFSIGLLAFRECILVFLYFF